MISSKDFTLIGEIRRIILRLFTLRRRTINDVKFHKPRCVVVSVGQYFREPVADPDASVVQQMASRRNRAVDVAALYDPRGRLSFGQSTRLSI